MQTESTGTKEVVNVRERLLKDGTKSLYLDIRHHGKRFRESLNLYLFDGNSKLIKELNRVTMAQAETIRAQRMLEIQSCKYDSLQQFKPSTYFLPYYRKMCEERFKTGDVFGDSPNPKMDFPYCLE